MPRIKVDKEEKYPRPYWPQELKDEGFVGDLLILDDAMTATIIHPKADLEQVKRSLHIILQDIDLRIAREKQSERPVVQEKTGVAAPAEVDQPTGAAAPARADK